MNRKEKMKKRPLCIATIIYIIGILMGLYLKISIAFLLIALIGVLSFFIICIKKDRKNFSKIKLIKILLIIIGILVLPIVQIKYIDYTYEKIYEGISKLQEIQISGIVITSKKEKEYSNQYKIKILEINGNRKYKGKKINLNIKKGNKKIEYGDLIRVQGEFKIPNEARNYGGFDYKKYLKTQKIYGTINTRELKVVEKDKVGVFQKIVYKVQESIKNNMRKVLPEKTEELCIGILIGIRENLEEKIEEDFKESNLTHMLAVSGSHISYIILGFSMVFSRISKRLSKIVTIFFLVFFIALTNFTPSVTRASVMGILMLIADLLYKKIDIYNNLASSTIMILAINPYTILDIGFQLSYAGTIGIILLDRKFKKIIEQKINIKNKIIKYIMNSVIVTLSANILIIPIMAYQFNTISFTFWISNLLAAPLMGASVILGFFVYVISLISSSLAKLFAIPLNFILILFLKIAEICSKLPFSSVLIKTPYTTTIIFYYLILFVIIYIKYLKLKIREYRIKEKVKRLKLKIYKKWIKQKNVVYIIVFNIIVIYILANIFFVHKQTLKIYFIDVGQGDASLVITPNNKKILIDGGGSETGSFDVGEKILLPYLLDRRITTLDYVMISHFDTDHVGGILSILEKIKVRNVILAKQGKNSENYSKFKEIMRKNKINCMIVQQGEKVQIEKDVFFYILFPEENQISENILNNNSIVAKLYYRNTSILFTGDIEEIAEKRVIAINEAKLKSTILKVAHHGSRSSSIQTILNKIQPKLALIGVRQGE